MRPQHVACKREWPCTNGLGFSVWYCSMTLHISLCTVYCHVTCSHSVCQLVIKYPTGGTIERQPKTRLSLVEHWSWSPSLVYRSSSPCHGAHGHRITLNRPEWRINAFSRRQATYGQNTISYLNASPQRWNKHNKALNPNTNLILWSQSLHCPSLLYCSPN